MYFANGIVFSFFSMSGVNDTLHCLNISDNSTFNYTLPTINGSIAVSPDRRFAIIWTRSAEFFVFDVAQNFSLLATSALNAYWNAVLTQDVKFSSDSAFAILETDNRNPVFVINLNNLNVAFSFVINNEIVSVDFIDVTNRFLLVNCVNATYIFDTETSNTIMFNASLAADSVLVDQNSSQLIADIGGTFTSYGINVTVNGSLLFSHNNTSLNETSLNITNSYSDLINSSYANTDLNGTSPNTNASRDLSNNAANSLN